MKYTYYKNNHFSTYLELKKFVENLPAFSSSISFEINKCKYYLTNLHIELQHDNLVVTTIFNYEKIHNINTFIIDIDDVDYIEINE